MEYSSTQEDKKLPRTPPESTTALTPPQQDSLLIHSQEDDLTLSTIQYQPQNTSKNSNSDSISLTRLLTRIRSVERLDQKESIQQSAFFPSKGIPKSPTEKRGGPTYLPRQLRNNNRSSTSSLLNELREGGGGSDLSILRLKAENLQLKEEMARMQQQIDVLRSSDVRYKAMVYDKLQRVNQLQNILRGLDQERKSQLKQKDALIRQLYAAVQKKEGHGGRSNRTMRSLSVQQLDEVSFMLSTVNISNQMIEESKKGEEQEVSWDRQREEWIERQHNLLSRIQELEKKERDMQDQEELLQRRISELEHFLSQSKRKEEKSSKRLEMVERCEKDHERKFKAAVTQSEERIEELQKQLQVAKGRKQQINQLQRQLAQTKSKLQLLEGVQQELQEIKKQFEEFQEQMHRKKDVIMQISTTMNEKIEGQPSDQVKQIKKRLSKLQNENKRMKDEMTGRERSWATNLASITRAKEAQFEKLRSTFVSKLHHYRQMLTKCGIHSAKEGGMSARSYEQIIIQMQGQDEDAN